MHRLLGFCVFLLVLGAPAHLQAASTPVVLAITHVNVIPMNRAGILHDQTVIVTDQRISTVRAAAEVAVPPGAEVIDGKGQYLIPGLIDAHVHLYTRQQLTLYLANGVTTVFNLNGRPLHLMWREGIAKGQLLGPRIYTVGPKFDRADPPEKAIALVDQYAAQGYDGVKIYDQVSKEEFPALIDAAKRHNLLIVGHVARAVGFEQTVQEGQAIAHAEEYLYTFFKEHGKGGPPDPTLIPQAVAITRASEVPVIATLVTYEHILEQGEDFPGFLRRPEMRYWSPWEMETIESPAQNPYLNFSKDDVTELRRNYAFLQTLVKALHDGGVSILAGTDSGWIQTVPGFALHQELQELVRAGLTPFEALQCATVAPARFLRGEREFGTVEEGKVADLVLLRGNPLEDISDTTEIVGVAAKGRWLSKAELDRMMREIPGSYVADFRRAEDTLKRNPAEGVSFLRGIDPFFELGTAVIQDIAVREGPKAVQRAVTPLARANAETPLSSPDLLNDIADNFLEKHRTNDAIEIYRFNIAQHPKAAIAYDRLGRAYFKLAECELSLKFYKQALETDPNYWNADFAKKRIAELEKQLGSAR